MDNNELTLEQKLAILAVNYQEIKTIFEELPTIKGIKGDKARRARILTDLSLLLRDFKIDPDSDLIYNIFDKK